MNTPQSISIAQLLNPIPLDTDSCTEVDLPVNPPSFQCPRESEAGGERMDVDIGTAEMMDINNKSATQKQAGSKDVFSMLRREHLEKPVEVEMSGRKQVLSVVDDSGKVGKKSKIRGGQSSSAVWECLQNEKHTEGSLSKQNRQLASFTTKILAIDSHAEVIHGKVVQHSLCEKHLQMKYAYSMLNFKTHIQNCSGQPKSSKLPGSGMKSISNYFQSQPNMQSECHLPCPGLSDSKFSDIKAYLEHTGTLGGSASSVSVIACELYGKKYQWLSKSQKAQVKIAQKQDWAWKNDADMGWVFSTSCLAKATCHSGKPEACMHCLVLLKNKQFKNALHMPTPPNENYKYINHEYQNKALALLYGKCTDLHGIMEVEVSVCTYK